MGDSNRNFTLFRIKHHHEADVYGFVVGCQLELQGGVERRTRAIDLGLDR